MRFEVDACLPVENSANALDGLLSGFSKLSVESKSTNDKTSKEAPKEGSPEKSKSKGIVEEATVSSPPIKSESFKCIKISSSGTLVPQENIIELTSCSENYVSTINWVELYPQLFLSHTPHLYLGVHTFGKFKKIEKHELHEMTIAAKKCEDNLKMLVEVLHRIQEEVLKLGSAKPMSLACVNGTLKLYETKDGKSALPQELLDFF